MALEDFFTEKQFDFELEKQKFIDNMDMLKEMSVQENTLYKKWQEFNKTDGLHYDIEEPDIEPREENDPNPQPTAKGGVRIK